MPSFPEMLFTFGAPSVRRVMIRGTKIAKTTCGIDELNFL